MERIRVCQESQAESKAESIGLTLPKPPDKPHLGTFHILDIPDEGAWGTRNLGNRWFGAAPGSYESAVYRAGTLNVSV